MLVARRAGFHIVLRVEVRTGGVRRSACVYDRQMAGLVYRQEGRQPGMEPKEPVQVEGRLVRPSRPARLHHCELGTMPVEVLVAERSHHAQAVRGSALKDAYQRLLALLRVRIGAECGLA